ncbi:MAG: hypothetical protein HRT89_24685 [Lentisphaeria bacterium]|nr:hypothetical protein [Lentisphaeria bacterium]NQZ71254.1 hypothetical protein [Lentisphaeria bacterium]
MTDKHASIDELEAYRKGEADLHIKSHVEACEHCTAELEFLESVADELSFDLKFDAIPAEKNEEILTMIAIQSNEINTRYRSKNKYKYLLAAAAAVIFITFVSLWSPGVGTISHKNPVVVKQDPMDLNKDQSVNIVDAYLMAMKLESGNTADLKDLNNDKQIDQGDLQQFTASIVMLKKGDE